MKKRRLLLLSFVAAVTAPIGGLAVYWTMQPEPKPGITVENFRRVRKGMTVAEVDSVMGVPHTHWAADTVLWESDDVIICFDLDNTDLVRGGICDLYEGEKKIGGERLYDSVWRWIKDWMGL